MTLHVMVEGPSEDAFLTPWLDRLVNGVELKIHRHQGKGALPQDVHAPPDRQRRGLLDQLPAKLRGFATSRNKPKAVVVLVDADNENPAGLACTIEAIARDVAPRLRVLVRVAVEETEAFYLGDLRALARAFPDADMEKARAYTPDSICGTWELFGEIVGDDGCNKVAWAEAMGPRVTVRPSESRSPSLRGLIAGILDVAT